MMTTISKSAAEYAMHTLANKMFNSESINNNNDDNNKNKNSNTTATMTITPKKNYKNNITATTTTMIVTTTKTATTEKEASKLGSFNMHICLRYRWGMGHAWLFSIRENVSNNERIYHSASFFWIFLRMAKYCTVAFTVDAAPFKSNWTFLGFYKKKSIKMRLYFFWVEMPSTCY